jgi:glycosyltransferase involved in cell wall biosynthesis
MPKISAIITTWNRSDMLGRAIQSVLAQTFSDFELLILDNNSTDDTESVARSFRDPRIRYIKHAPQNIAGARDIGLRESAGEYLAFLDDDDEWLPEKLADELSIFDQDAAKKVGLVYGAYIHIDQATGKTFETIYPKHRGDVYAYAVSHEDTFTGSASNPMLRKSAVIGVGGYDGRVTTGEDYEMFLRLAKQYEFDYVSKPVLNVFVHAGYRLSHQVEAYINTEKIIYEKHYNFISQHPAVNARYLQVIAGRLLRLGKPQEARPYLKKAFRAYPWSPITPAQFVLSFFPVAAYRFVHAQVIKVIHGVRRRL